MNDLASKLIAIIASLLLGFMGGVQLAKNLPYRDDYPTIVDMEYTIEKCEKSLPRDKKCRVVLTTIVVDN